MLRVPCMHAQLEQAAAAREISTAGENSASAGDLNTGADGVPAVGKHDVRGLKR